MIYFSESPAVESAFESKFGALINTTFGGQVHHFLGLAFDVTTSSSGQISICLSQQAFIESLLEEYDYNTKAVKSKPSPYRSPTSVQFNTESPSSSRRQPKLSAYACLFGNFDFNRTPLAVPGTRVIIHETPAQRRSFAVHGLDGFYVSPSLEHYRSHKILVTSTQATRDCISVEWFPSVVPFPQVTQEDYLRQTADDLLVLLRGQPSTNVSPSLTYASTTRNAFIEIAQLLKRATTPLQASSDAPAPPLQASHDAPASIPPAVPPRTPPHVLTPAGTNFQVFSPPATAPPPTPPMVQTPRVSIPRM